MCHLRTTQYTALGFVRFQDKRKCVRSSKAEQGRYNPRPTGKCFPVKRMPRSRLPSTVARKAEAGARAINYMTEGAEHQHRHNPISLGCPPILGFDDRDSPIPWEMTRKEKPAQTSGRSENVETFLRAGAISRSWCARPQTQTASLRSRLADQANRSQPGYGRDPSTAQPESL